MWHSLNLFIILHPLALNSIHQPGRSEEGWGRLYPQVITFPEESTLKKAVKTDLLFQHSIIIITLFFKIHAHFRSCLQPVMVAVYLPFEKTGESGTSK